eukprot:m.467366 g.467366  ORF g.467366 m.467366 type:complete len:306 (-) comp21638_c0_seq3:1392-2309(-)
MRGGGVGSESIHGCSRVWKVHARQEVLVIPVAAEGCVIYGRVVRCTDHAGGRNRKPRAPVAPHDIRQFVENLTEENVVCAWRGTTRATGWAVRVEEEQVLCSHQRSMQHGFLVVVIVPRVDAEIVVRQPRLEGIPIRRQHSCPVHVILDRVESIAAIVSIPTVVDQQGSIARKRVVEREGLLGPHNGSVVSRDTACRIASGVQDAVARIVAVVAILVDAGVREVLPQGLNGHVRVQCGCDVSHHGVPNRCWVSCGARDGPPTVTNPETLVHGMRDRIRDCRHLTNRLSPEPASKQLIHKRFTSTC